MTPPISRLLVAVLAMTGLAQAQLAGSLQLSKNQYLSGEAIIAVVSITNHTSYDYPAILEAAQFLFDSRNALGQAGQASPKVVRL